MNENNPEQKESSICTTEDFLHRVFHSADPSWISYLTQLNDVDKKDGVKKTQSFKIEHLDKMSNAVQMYNRNPYGVSFSLGLLDKNIGKQTEQN